MLGNVFACVPMISRQGHGILLLSYGLARCALVRTPAFAGASVRRRS